MAVAAIPYVMMAAAAVMSAVGSIQQGNAQKKLANYNAGLLDQQAESTLAWSKYNADRQREKANRLNATAEAMFAGSGVEVTSGSPLAVLADNEAQAEMENLAILRMGITESNNLKAQAAGARFQGQIAMKSSRIQAGSSLLSAAGSAYGAYSNWNAGPSIFSSQGSLGANNGGFTQNPGGIDAQ
jgi:hypothetical protein